MKFGTTVLMLCLASSIALAQDASHEIPEGMASPPVLNTPTIGPVTSASDWQNRARSAVQELLSREMYGFMPPAPASMKMTLFHEDRTLQNGKVVMKQIRLIFSPNAPATDLLLFVPVGDRPAPVILGLNFYGNHATHSDPRIPITKGWMPARWPGVVDNKATPETRNSAASRWPIQEALNRGYAVATLYHGDLDPDQDDFSDGIHPHIALNSSTDRTADSWSALAAWAWGLHRAVDYLETDPDIDADRIAVMGHSRNGKAALLAGATDERIGLVISNQSGCGGAALSKRKMGETVKAINDRFPHWFNINFRQYNENEDALGFDQHHLIALIAPRPVLVASAEEDLWADPEGEFLALKGASPVYELLGRPGIAEVNYPALNTLVGEVLGYHVRPGGHAVGSVDWKVFMDFADRQWGKP